jgi:hypothetical protein
LRQKRLSRPPQPPANGERIFSVDPFDSDHSVGYFCVKDSIGHGDLTYGTEDEDGEWTGWRGSNDARSNQIYLDHHDGACFNGTYFDIREYVWQEDCQYYDNSIIYGHHMQNGTMFAGISWYEEQSYYDAHPVMYLRTPAAAYRIDLFSGYITTMDSSAYMQNFGSIQEHTDWLKEVSGRSDFRANREISAYDRVITLSTCAYRFENARYVLHGKLVELR